MADVRVVPNFVLSDGTTYSQIAAVDASGRLSVNLTASSATVTVDTELPTAAALSDTTGNPTTSMVGGANMLWDNGGTQWTRWRQVVNGLDSTGIGMPAAAITGQLDDTSTGAVTENQFAPVRISTRRALLIEGVASGTNVNIALAASSATVTVDTELPAAAALSDTTANPTAPMVGAAGMLWDGSTNWIRAKSAATLADNLTNPGAGLGMQQVFLMAWDSTNSNWDRVISGNNTGRLQVDVVSGGSADTPTNPTSAITTSASLAAGSATTTQLRTSDLGGTTKKLSRVVCWASVPYKAELQSVSNGTGTQVLVEGNQAGQPTVMEPPGGRTGRNYWSVAFSANAGFDGWQVLMTNLDASEAADVYCTMYYED